MNRDLLALALERVVRHAEIAALAAPLPVSLDLLEKEIERAEYALESARKVFVTEASDSHRQLSLPWSHGATLPCSTEQGKGGAAPSPSPSGGDEREATEPGAPRRARRDREGTAT